MSSATLSVRPTVWTIRTYFLPANLHIGTSTGSNLITTLVLDGSPRIGQEACPKAYERKLY
jgi:hypothetical protein